MKIGVPSENLARTRPILFFLFIFSFFHPALLTNFATAGCPALEPPSGPTVTVDSEAEMFDAVNSASSGTTILIEDGTYNLGANGYYLWLDTPNVTLRSASANRQAVILDDQYLGSEVITIAASDVTVADLTIKRAATHAIHVVSTDSGDTLNTLIYNVHIIDPGQQAIKINPHEARVYFPDSGTIACSHIELTRSGAAMVLSINGSCYTGGIDGHQARDWSVLENRIEGFWCDTGLSEHGVHFWSGSRDTVVERNEIYDNTRGIGFGLSSGGSARTYGDDPCPGTTGFVDHYRGVIRNNFIHAHGSGLFSSQYGVDSGVSLAQACNARVLHNTVAFTDVPFNCMEWRFSNTSAEIANNLVTHNLMSRDGASATLSGNLDYQNLSLFIDSQTPDLHLEYNADSAIDNGVSVTAGMCDDDFDEQSRPIGSGLDVGADESSYIWCRAHGIWNTASTWEDNSVPQNGDSTVISEDLSVQVDSMASCSRLILNSTGSLVIGSGGRIELSL